MVPANSTLSLYPRLAAKAIGNSPSSSSPLINSPSSIYRPLVRAHDRIGYWHSPTSIKNRVSRILNAHPSDMDRLDTLTDASLKSSTLSTYGSGLAHWIAWCDLRGLPEHDRLPASAHHLALFLGYLSRHKSEAVLRTAMSGLRHWHELNGLKWAGDDAFVRKIRHAAGLAAPVSVRPRRSPVTIPHLVALRENLNFANTFDSAVFAVACTAFWGVCRLGELTVPSLISFDPRFHVSKSAATRTRTNPDGSTASLTFHVPWSKTTALLGADIVLTANAELTCPVVAFQHHLLSNASVPNDHGLFSYIEKGQPKFLTKKAFLSRCAAIWGNANLEMVQGHSFRIGGTTEFLQRGLSLDLIQIQGRWTSEAFKLYLRKLDEILSSAIVSISPELVARVRDRMA